MIKTFPKIKLLLFGGGLVHAYLLSIISKEIFAKLEVTLVSEAPIIYYSGMASGYLEGIFTDAEVAIDLRKLCSKKGVKYFEGIAKEIDKDRKLILLEDGREIPFDFLALNTDGSGLEVEGVQKYGISIRLGDNLRKVKQHFTHRSINLNITVVGADKLGIEIALALKHLLNKLKLNANLTIIDAGQSILHGYDLKLKKVILDELKTNRVELLLGKKVVRVTGDILIFNDNSILEYGYLIWAAKSAVNSTLRSSGLTVDEKGLLKVNQYLQSVDTSYIFGSGENVTINGFKPFSKDPVNSIKEAKVLLENILCFGNRNEFKKYYPVEKIHKIINTGHQKSVFQWYGLVIKGILGWHIRNYQEKKLVKRIQY